jgi:hypothetical protein
MTEHNPKGEIHCDFCASTTPVTIYECDDFKLDSAAPVPRHSGSRSVRACAERAALIDGGQWPEVVERALVVFEEYNKSVPYTNTRDEIRQDIAKCFAIMKQHMRRRV